MHKNLKLCVSAIQVLLVTATVVWYRLASSDQAFVGYAMPARDLVAMKLNWPLVVAWSPVVYLMERLSSNQNPSLTAIQIAGAIAFGLAIISSLAAFWYLVVVESQARKRGGSVVRFQSALGELAKIVFLFIGGVAAPIYAYVDGRALLVAYQDNPRFVGLAVDAFLGGVFLVTWGMILTMVAVHDLRLLARRTRRPSSPAVDG